MEGFEVDRNVWVSNSVVEDPVEDEGKDDEDADGALDKSDESVREDGVKKVPPRGPLEMYDGLCL